KVESPIDGRTVALSEAARELRLIAPLSQQRLLEPAGEQAWRGGGAENDPRALPRRAGDLAPQLVQLRIRHPVLGIEQDVAIERGLRPALEIFREGAVSTSTRSARERMVSKCSRLR